MKLIPLGDYYVWYCDWCDSRNLTLWTRIDVQALACGACCASLRFPSQARSDLA